MTLILLAIIAYLFCYPAVRALDRWVQRIEWRIENDVEIRRRAAMNEEAVAMKREAR
jgi:hypothetical protein